MTILLIMVALAATAWGITRLVAYQDEQRELTALSTKTELPVSDLSQVPAHDWTKLRDESPEIAAWISVGNTTIDYPVMKPASDRPQDFYLHHDPWGKASETGTPYLGGSSQPDGMHSLVLGHHLAATGQMFTPLAKTYLQEDFDGIGELTWETPGRTEALRPICALSVDASYQDIQRYQFETHEELREWLAGICEQATARAEGWQDAAANATRVVTLVTCSSDLAGQPERTLTLFVE